jgi:hypothetical protein
MLYRLGGISARPSIAGGEREISKKKTEKHGACISTIEKQLDFSDRQGDALYICHSATRPECVRAENISMFPCGKLGVVCMFLFSFVVFLLWHFREFEQETNICYYLIFRRSALFSVRVQRAVCFACFP